MLWQRRAEGKSQRQRTQINRNSVCSTASGTSCFVNSAVVNWVYISGRIRYKRGSRLKSWFLFEIELIHTKLVTLGDLNKVINFIFSVSRTGNSMCALVQLRLFSLYSNVLFPSCARKEICLYNFSFS